MVEPAGGVITTALKEVDPVDTATVTAYPTSRQERRLPVGVIDIAFLHCPGVTHCGSYIPVGVLLGVRARIREPGIPLNQCIYVDRTPHILLRHAVCLFFLQYLPLG